MPGPGVRASGACSVSSQPSPHAGLRSLLSKHLGWGPWSMTPYKPSASPHFRAPGFGSCSASVSALVIKYAPHRREVVTRRSRPGGRRSPLYPGHKFSVNLALC